MAGRKQDWTPRFSRRAFRRECEDVVREAEYAFWDIVASRFPEVQSGDVEPMTAVEQRRNNLEAILTWLSFNAPDPLASEAREWKKHPTGDLAH